MKKILLLLCCMVALSAFAQETIDSTGLAKVNKRKGVELYIMSEPIRPYDVTGEVTNEDVASVIGTLNGNKDNRTLLQMIDVLLNNANRKKKKGKLDYDAIIVAEDGSSGTLIKFTDNVKAK